jgi:cytochrome d ubiquinol oxidase subunit I
MIMFDRFLFAFTVASHIILVTTSISLIVIIAIAEFLSIRRNDAQYGELVARLTKVFTISFGVGTASGIVMAVELAALFPAFMTLVSQSGAVSLLYAEVFAFFLETLALVLFVYYPRSLKNRLSHWALSVLILAGALMSAVFITMLNAWMNTPNDLAGLNPWQVFVTSSTFAEVAHVLATTLFTGFAMIGAYFAYRYLKVKAADERAVLAKGLKICWILSIILIVFVGLTGGNEMTTLIQTQPVKYAAIEANTVNGTNLPERLFGGISNGVWSGGIPVPGAQSLLAKLEAGITKLPGLDQYNPSIWPPLWIHTTADTMISGGIIIGFFLFVGLAIWVLGKKRPYESRKILYFQVVLGAASLVFYESGWVTDEVGRFPWIVYNVMTVNQAANTSSSLLVPGLLIVIFYLALVPATFYFFSRVFNEAPASEHVAWSEKGGAEH